MKCFNCGFGINDSNALFCPSCGRRLTVPSGSAEIPSEKPSDDMVSRIQSSLDEMVSHEDSMRQDAYKKPEPIVPVGGSVPGINAPVPPPLGNPMPGRGMPVPPPLGNPMPGRGMPVPPPVGNPVPGRGAPVPPPGNPMPGRSMPVHPSVGNPMPGSGMPVPPQVRNPVPSVYQNAEHGNFTENNCIASESQMKGKKKKPQQIRYGMGTSEKKEEKSSEGNIKSALAAFGVGVGIAAALSAVIAVPVILLIIF